MALNSISFSWCQIYALFTYESTKFLVYSDKSIICELKIKTIRHFPVLKLLLCFFKLQHVMKLFWAVGAVSRT